MVISNMKVQWFLAMVFLSISQSSGIANIILWALATVGTCVVKLGDAEVVISGRGSFVYAN